MATIGHIAAGIALARGMGPSRSRFPTPWLVVGAAVLPDIDLLFDVSHRGPTHSIGFAALVGAGAYAIARTSGAGDAARIGLLCFLAVLTHALLDVATAHTPVAALWPLSSRELVLPFLVLPSAPTDEALLSLRGGLALLAELAWSAGLILAAEWARRRSAGRRVRGHE